MPIALVTTAKDPSRRKKKLVVSGTLSGAYVTGGIPIDWTTVANPKLFTGGKPGSNPTSAVLLNAPQGYNAELIQGSTMKNWLLKIWNSPGTEMGAVAFPAGLIADPFSFELTGPMGGF